MKILQLNLSVALIINNNNNNNKINKNNNNNIKKLIKSIINMRAK